MSTVFYMKNSYFFASIGVALLLVSTAYISLQFLNTESFTTGEGVEEKEDATAHPYAEVPYETYVYENPYGYQLILPEFVSMNDMKDETIHMMEFMDNKWQTADFEVIEGNLPSPSFYRRQGVIVLEEYFRSIRPYHFLVSEEVDEGEIEHQLFVNLMGDQHLQVTYMTAPDQDVGRIEKILRGLRTFPGKVLQEIKDDVPEQVEAKTYELHLSFPDRWGDVSNYGTGYLDTGKSWNYHYSEWYHFVHFFSNDYSPGYGEGSITYFFPRLTGAKGVEEARKILEETHTDITSIEKISLYGFEIYKVDSRFGYNKWVDRTSWLIAGQLDVEGMQNVSITHPRGEQYETEAKDIIRQLAERYTPKK